MTPSEKLMPQPLLVDQPISERKKDIDIVNVIRDSGVELKRNGKIFVGLCPFHSEKTPSFTVSPDRHRYHCFGCQDDGDVIDFVKKSRGLTFQDALTFLGINCQKNEPKLKMDIMRRKQYRELEKDFRKWEDKEADKLSFLVRNTRRLLLNIVTLQDLEKYGDLYHIIAEWEDQLNVFIYGDDELKLEYFKYRRGYL